MEKLTKEDHYSIKAAEHFEIDINEVTEKHRRFIKEQEYALNYGFMGSPLLTYRLDESGVVDFDSSSQDVLADQFDHRFPTLR